MTEILGGNGKPLNFDAAQLIGDDIKNYEIGEVKVATADSPEQVLAMATKNARGFLMQQGQYAAAQQANPFQFEPCALAVFMMLANEVKRLNDELEKLKGESNAESGD